MRRQVTLIRDTEKNTLRAEFADFVWLFDGTDVVHTLYTSGEMSAGIPVHQLTLADFQVSNFEGFLSQLSNRIWKFAEKQETEFICKPVISERDSIYGSFENAAFYSQQLCSVIANASNNKRLNGKKQLSYFQREKLTAMCHIIARILAAEDPSYEAYWLALSSCVQQENKPR
jgi:hypothetical protein